jgi:2',3'-cyclic-nucleotide 2'-phosphodiesterase (5'-nucleotidase family)
VDAGNSLLGDRVFSQASRGATSIEAMNLLGYDAMTLGPKDLELGVEELRKRVQEAEFPILAANISVTSSGELIAQDYVIRHIGGHQVAIIGLSEGARLAGFTVADPLQTLQRILPEVQSKADIIILLTHLTPTRARALGNAVEGIDLIVTGGDEHLALGEMVGGALMVHADMATPGHAGRNLGLVTMDFDSQGLLLDQTNTIVVLTQAAVEEDPDMLEWLTGVQVVSAPAIQ